MRGHEIEARERRPAARAIKIRTAGDPRRELAHRIARAAPEIAHAVAILAVPLFPVDRKVPDPVAALAEIPRLRDQLDSREPRILHNRREERTQSKFPARAARERGRKVEAEPIHMP